MTIEEEIRFWSQAIKDSERVIICSPELESRVKSHIAALGLEGSWTVEVSPFVPDTQVIIFDRNALDAITRQSLLRRPVVGGDR